MSQFIDSQNSVRQQLREGALSLAKVLCLAMDDVPGFIPCGHAFADLYESLYQAENQVDEVLLAQQLQVLLDRIEHISSRRGVPYPDPVALDLTLDESGRRYAFLSGLAARLRLALLLDIDDPSCHAAFSQLLVSYLYDRVASCDLEAEQALATQIYNKLPING